MERIQKLQEYLLASPGDSFLKHALALEFLKLGENGRSRLLFEEILAADPGYIGSYYHLAKLLESMGETALAINWYEKGMEAAKKAGDQHTYGELRSALEELTF